jgi:hypothetical protein
MQMAPSRPRQSLGGSEHDRPSRYTSEQHGWWGASDLSHPLTVATPPSRTCLLTRKRKRGNSGKNPFAQQRAGFQQKQNLESAGHEVHTD